MGNVYTLRPPAEKAVVSAQERAAEMSDALRCLDTLVGADEERLSLLSNDLRGMLRVLSREAAAISEQLMPRI